MISAHYNKIFIRMIDHYQDMVMFCSNIYDNLDPAHGREHMKEVVVATDIICDQLHNNGYEVNKDLAICIAYLHDIGRIVRNKDHELHSCTLFNNVRNLHKYFNEDELFIIRHAIIHHRSSAAKKIFKGKSTEKILSDEANMYLAILYDADKSNRFDANRCKERVISYNTYYYKNNLNTYSHEQICDNAYDRFIRSTKPTTSYTGLFQDQFNKLFEDKNKISKEEFIEEFEDWLRMEGYIHEEIH